MALKRLLLLPEDRLALVVEFLRLEETLAAAVFWKWWEVLRVEVEGAETYSRMSASDILICGKFD